MPFPNKKGDRKTHGSKSCRNRSAYFGPARCAYMCVQGSAQKQDVAEPLCRPPSLTLSVHGAREGPAPRAQVSSLWALPCPLPGVSDPLGGAGALPFPWRHHSCRSGEAQSEKSACCGWAMASWCWCPRQGLRCLRYGPFRAPCPGSPILSGAQALSPSPGGITAADLVKPRAKSPRAAVGRWHPGAGALLAMPAPAAPQPLLGLPGVESTGDPACTGRLPAAVGRRCAEGWLKSPLPPPPPLRGCRLAALLRLCPVPRVGAPILVAAVLPLWPPLPLPAPGRRRRWGGWGRGPLPRLPGTGEESRERKRGGRSSAPAQGAGWPLVGGGGGRDPSAVIPPLRPWLPCGASAGAGPRSPARWRSCCPGVTSVSVPAAVGNALARCPAALA